MKVTIEFDLNEVKAMSHPLNVIPTIKPKYRDPRATCNSCDLKETCPFAWDEYNIDGDCLADK